MMALKQYLLLQRRHFRKQRQGAILIGVLVCAAVVVALVAATTESTLRCRREARLNRQYEQTILLLNAAESRALSKLAKDPGYKGEVWKPDLSATRFNNSSADIQILPESNSSSSRVTVIAEVGGLAATDASIRRSRTLTIPVQNTSSSEK